MRDRIAGSDDPHRQPGRPRARARAARAGILAGVLTGVLAAAPAISSDWVEREATREAMQSIFQSLQSLMEVDVSEAGLAAPVNEQRVLEALRELDDQSAILASHGFSDDAVGVFLASVLERYSLMLLRGYERGEYEKVEEFLYGITDVCIACHTRLPSAEDSPVARRFVDSGSVASLSPGKRARIEVATRRFDDALNTLEMLIEASEIASPADPGALEEVLRAYLIVNIRVKGDMERPIPMLEIVQARTPAQTEWHRDLGSWIESLETYRDIPVIGDPLSTARDIIEAASDGSFPDERSAMVEYIAASSLLHRYLATRPIDTMELSEAHYLLGLSEYRIHRDDWLPQAELYLEIAIVLAPDAPWARPAYDLLVERIERTYAPMYGGQVPPEVEERLKELEEAIDGGRPPSARSSDEMPASLG